VLVPEGTPIGKLAQTLSYGARVLQIRGTYDDCVKLVREMSEKYGFFLCGDYAFRREGQKSIAYEIIEQLGWRAPDVLVCPVGFGTNLAGIYKGFVEFKRLGFIDALPKIIGVQAQGCAPIARAFEAGKRKYTPIEKPDTIAGAVAVGDPKDAPFIMDAVFETGGCVLSYSDDAILAAQTTLSARESVFVEPASALPLASLEDLATNKNLSKKLFGSNNFGNKIIVLIATGNGLKDPRALLKRVPTPPSADPDIREVDRFLRFKLYKLRTGMSLKEREYVIISGKTITVNELNKILKDQFDLRVPSMYVKDMVRAVEIFLKKGKPITRIDLQHIAEDTLKERAVRKVLEFVDFRVETSRMERPKASVVVKYKSRKSQGNAEGVGPFDAIINAFKKAIPSLSPGHNFELTDYVVEIDTARTDATVKVTMTMQDGKGSKVIGTGTSPDIIVASVLAYEEAFNLLCV
jgi:threonine synthase